VDECQQTLEFVDSHSTLSDLPTLNNTWISFADLENGVLLSERFQTSLSDPCSEKNHSLTPWKMPDPNNFLSKEEPDTRDNSEEELVEFPLKTSISSPSELNQSPADVNPSIPFTFENLPETLEVIDHGSSRKKCAEYKTNTKHLLQVKAPLPENQKKKEKTVAIHDFVYFNSQRKIPQPASRYFVSIDVVNHVQFSGGKFAVCRVSYPERNPEGKDSTILEIPEFYIAVDFTRAISVEYYVVLWDGVTPIQRSQKIGPLRVIEKGGKKKDKKRKRKETDQDFSILSTCYRLMTSHLLALFSSFFLVLN